MRSDATILDRGAPAGGQTRQGAPRQDHHLLAGVERLRCRATGFGYFLRQTTRPQTIGYALLDSPIAPAAWMLDAIAIAMTKHAGDTV